VLLQDFLSPGGCSWEFSYSKWCDKVVI